MLRLLIFEGVSRRGLTSNLLDGNDASRRKVEKINEYVAPVVDPTQARGAK